MHRRRPGAGTRPAARGVHDAAKRNNAGMDRDRDTTSPPTGEPGVTTDASVARYLEAIERSDPAETPEPAAALAALLAARLEGTDAPEARRILESFAPTTDAPSSEDQ